MFDKLFGGFDIAEYAFSAAGGAAVMAFGLSGTIKQLPPEAHAALGGAGVHLVTRKDTTEGIFSMDTLMHAAAGVGGAYLLAMVQKS